MKNTANAEPMRRKNLFILIALKDRYSVAAGP